MKDFLSTYLYPLTVFLTGACVLVIEILAVRVLSPYYGNTIYTVSSVLSVILAALSIGYYVGGRFADRHPAPTRFFQIILASGVLVVATHFLSIIILPFVSEFFSFVTGPLIAATVLFLVPALLLGTLSPYAIKLQSLSATEEGIGSVSGTIFFWSTLGSISGSLLAGFVLIPSFGVDQIFLGTGLCLFLLGLLPPLYLGWQKKKRIGLTAFTLLLALFSYDIATATPDDVIYQVDGVYEKLTILDVDYDGRPARFFLQDRSGSGAMYLDTDDPTDLPFEYTRYYSLYRIFKPNLEQVLVLGGGIFSIPKAVLAEQPDAVVDVAEIEPSLFELSQEYFNVEDTPNLNNHIEDGRRLLKQTDKQYDMIFSDVYYSLHSIPTHLTTQEFFAVAKERLSEDGIFVANIIGSLSRQQPSLALSEIRTFQSVFPHSYFFATEGPESTSVQNIILVGHNSDSPIDFNASTTISQFPPQLDDLRGQLIDINRYDLSQHYLLTDNYAPVDYLTAQTLVDDYDGLFSPSGREMMALIKQQLGYGTRYMGTKGHRQVQNFITTEMKTFTNDVQPQTWEYTATDGEVYELTNLVARLNPEKERRILIGTHYDTKRFAEKDPFDTSRPVPGANDSASSVAVMLELARHISQAGLELNVGIDFVFFDAEEGDPNMMDDYSEWEPIGSNYFADNLNDFYPEELPESAVVIDMVCDADLKIYQDGFSSEYAPVEVQDFWRAAMRVSPETFIPTAKYDIVDDHVALIEAGIPSVLVIDFDYPYHHTVEDTIDKCSAESLEIVANATLEYLMEL